MERGAYCAGVAAFAALLLMASGAARADVPPRSVADIAAILDNEKLDPERLRKIEAQLNAEPPTDARPGQMVEFLAGRAAAKFALGRYTESVADLEKAIEVGREAGINVDRLRGSLSGSYRFSGQILKALELELAREKDLKASPNPSPLLYSYRQTVLNLLQLGEVERAEGVLKKMEAARNVAGARPGAAQVLTHWESHVEDARARIFEARGLYREAESTFQKAVDLFEDARLKSSRWPNPPSQDGFISARDSARSFAGMNKARQGRFKEAEIDARRGLMSELQYFGKYGGNTPKSIEMLGQIVMMQGRYADAERLFRLEVGIIRDLGFGEDNPVLVRPWALQAKTASLQERWSDAADIYDRIAAAIDGKKGWTQDRIDSVLATPDRVLVLYRTGRVDEGIKLATKILNRLQNRIGDQHFDAAMARGQLAMGYTLAKREEAAFPLFQASIPSLTAMQPADDSSGGAALSAMQVRQIVETYIVMLSSFPEARAAGIDPALESLKLVDFIRGQSVQRALAASSARAATRDPDLASLVRQDQDDERKVDALFQAINDALSLPPEQRDDGAIKQMQTDVTKLRAKRGAAWKAIERKFPEYANLINPRAPTIEEIRTALKPGEAFLSFYLARENSFVWVVPKTGAVAFASAPVGAAEIEQKVNKLREALEPKADTLDGVPPFDVTTAYELYSLLLKPVEATWKPANSLVLVTNGALGLLPLGLLPTAPVTVRADSGQPMFAEYRTVPWLARTHAVTMVPSAAALKTLRSLPASKSTREPMIGFGDPLFSREQAAEAAREPGMQIVQASGATRGVPLTRRNAPKTAGVAGAELALLPRLPDTSDELKSIALALQADPAKALHLGKEANTRKVKTINLSGYKVVAFATHGLVAGELEGLSQPALALSAPDVADVDGDGLLTMEEILGLKLDADWVVLSACNTGAGSGAGAEAASGLGRAFFYAGSRALLVTNWSVHSASARELVTDLFHRQTQDARMTRSEALRQSMMALLDSPGYQDSGRTLFTYGHPIFWAPYSIIGDGGGA
jgi:CHAT domain-containing protein